MSIVESTRPRPLTTRVSDVRAVYATSPLASLDAVCADLERFAADMHTPEDPCFGNVGPWGITGIMAIVDRIRNARMRILVGAMVAASDHEETPLHFARSLLPQPLDARPSWVDAPRHLDDDEEESASGTRTTQAAAE